MIVVDASVLAVALGDDGPSGELSRARLGGERLAAPQLIDLEVTSAWRRHVAAGTMLPRRADLAIADLGEIPLERSPHVPLLRRCWELRDNLSIYDAAYVALAEILGVPLLTADRRLASAPKMNCAIELLQ